MSQRPLRRIAVAAGLVAVLVIPCCGARPSTPRSSIVVFAAASLKITFTELSAEFSRANPGAAVELSFAGSADLVAQLAQGASADVFASADTGTMDKAVSASLVSGLPVSFASNTLAIAVPPGNPNGIRSFRDLPRFDVVVCAPQVPCGAAVPRIEAEVGVQLAPISEESSVTDVLNKVASGQADAGLVYRTDTIAAGDTVTAVPFPEAARAVNSYRIAALRQSPEAALAQRFIDLVISPTGRGVLAAAGFGTI